MQDDEITLDLEEEYQEEETLVAEEAIEEQAEAPKEEGVKLSPAEYRHFKKWQSSQKEPAPKAPTQPQSVSSQPNNVEEVVLLANGMQEELLRELKAVAQARGISSLIKAQNDPIFVAVKEKFEKDQKQKESNLQPSRGSGNAKPKKDFDTPGLTREEHMKMVRDSS